MGVADTRDDAPVGVFWAKTGGNGAPGETVPDPYFGGAGPTRTACTECGSCDRLSRRRQEHSRQELPRFGGIGRCAGHRAHHRRRSVPASRRSRWGGVDARLVVVGPFGARKRTFTADNVVMAAGTSQHAEAHARGQGSTLQDFRCDGVLTRTNSESILGAMASKVDPQWTSPKVSRSPAVPSRRLHAHRPSVTARAPMR